VPLSTSDAKITFSLPLAEEQVEPFQHPLAQTDVASRPAFQMVANRQGTHRADSEFRLHQPAKTTPPLSLLSPGSRNRAPKKSVKPSRHKYFVTASFQTEKSVADFAYDF
jgi:hypothetical protein